MPLLQSFALSFSQARLRLSAIAVRPLNCVHTDLLGREYISNKSLHCDCGARLDIEEIYAD